MRNALTTLIKFSLEIEWTNTDDDERKKNWLAFSWVRMCRLTEATIRVKMLVLNFHTAILFKNTHTHIYKHWNVTGDWRLSCVRVIIASFLRKLTVGLSFTVTNAMAFLCSSCNCCHCERHSCHMKFSKSGMSNICIGIGTDEST